MSCYRIQNHRNKWGAFFQIYLKTIVKRYLKTDQIGLGHCLRVFNPNDIPRFTAFISHLVMGFSWHAQLHANRWLNIGRESIKAM